MTFTLTRPRRGMFPALDDVNRVFDSFVRRDVGWDETAGWLPPVDIVETKNELVVKADVPGLEKDNFKVSVENNVLTIKGEKKLEYNEEDREHNYHRMERTYGTFTRSFTLPNTVDTKGVKASYKNGVLEVSLPKAEESKPKEIEINVG